ASQHPFGIDPLELRAMALVVATRGDPANRIGGCNAARPANLGPRSAVAKRQNIGGSGPAPPQTEEWNMRSIAIAGVVAAGGCLCAAGPSRAGERTGDREGRHGEPCGEEGALAASLPPSPLSSLLAVSRRARGAHPLPAQAGRGWRAPKARAG